jgi:hypothetical protein
MMEVPWSMIFRCTVMERVSASLSFPMLENIVRKRRGKK